MQNKYYLTQRGPGPGALPRSSENLITDVEDFGTRIYVEKINCRAWGYVQYEKPLTKKEISDYELVEEKEEVGVPFSEKRMFDCMGCCEACPEQECPHNETRCL